MFILTTFKNFNFKVVLNDFVRAGLLRWCSFFFHGGCRRPPLTGVSAVSFTLGVAIKYSRIIVFHFTILNRPTVVWREHKPQCLLNSLHVNAAPLEKQKEEGRLVKLFTRFWQFIILVFFFNSLTVTVNS